MSKLDDFCDNLWQMPTSDLLALYTRASLPDGTALHTLVEGASLTYLIRNPDPVILSGAMVAVTAEIDRRFPVVRCAGCGGRPHSGAFCPGPRVP